MSTRYWINGPDWFQVFPAIVSHVVAGGVAVWSGAAAADFYVAERLDEHDHLVWSTCAGCSGVGRECPVHCNIPVVDKTRGD